MLAASVLQIYKIFFNASKKTFILRSPMLRKHSIILQMKHISYCKEAILHLGPNKAT